MNIAFQAFLLILFYLPGALFMSALFGKLSKDQELPVLTTSMSGRAAASVLFALLFHGIWFYGIEQLNALHVLNTAGAADKFFILLSGNTAGEDYKKADVWASQNIGSLAWYFVTVCIGAIAFGVLAYNFIEHKKIGKFVPWLRFKPKWHYVLSGEYTNNTKSIPIVWVDLLCEIEKKNVVYSGKIEGYWFDEKTGALDFLFLSGAERSSISLDTPPQSQDSETLTAPTQHLTANVVDILGDTLIVKMSEVKNINVQYFDLVPDGQHSDAEATASELPQNQTIKQEP